MLEPEVRAAMAKDFLALLEGGKFPRGTELLAALPREYVEQVRGVSRLAWLPAAPLAKHAEGCRVLLGDKEWVRGHRNATEDLLKRPLFSAFFSGMRTVLGATAASALRLAPTLLSHAHRNYGEISCVFPSSERGLVRFVHCPPSALSLGMVEVFAGTLEGMVEPFSRSVRSTIEYAPGSREANIELNWQ